MIVTKRRKQHEQSPMPTPSLSHKLFVDYPYPIITELNKTYQQQKKSDPSYTFTSLQWYKDSFEKLFGILHNLHGQYTPTTIIEQTFRQAHIDGRSSKVMIKDLQKKTKPTRFKRILASSLKPSLSDPEEQTNHRHLRRRYMRNDTPDDDRD